MDEAAAAAEARRAAAAAVALVMVFFPSGAGVGAAAAAAAAGDLRLVRRLLLLLLLAGANAGGGAGSLPLLLPLPPLLLLPLRKRRMPPWCAGAGAAALPLPFLLPLLLAADADEEEEERAPRDRFFMFEKGRLLHLAVVGLWFVWWGKVSLLVLLLPPDCTHTHTRAAHANKGKLLRSFSSGANSAKTQQPRSNGRPTALFLFLQRKEREDLRFWFAEHTACVCLAPSGSKSSSSFTPCAQVQAGGVVAGHTHIARRCHRLPISDHSPTPPSPTTRTHSSTSSPAPTPQVAGPGRQASTEKMAMASYDGDAAGGALGGMAVASSSSSSSVVSAEERQLQLDFHALLADYVVGRRKVERHPDAEQRWVGMGNVV